MAVSLLEALRLGEFVEVVIITMIALVTVASPASGKGSRILKDTLMFFSIVAARSENSQRSMYGKTFAVYLGLVPRKGCLS